MRRGLLPALLFVAAAGGVAVLGSRIVETERAAAEGTARERLRARAQEAAGIILAAAASVPEPAFRWSLGSEGGGWRFVRPAEPARPPRLLLPGPAPETAFYLDEGERAEAVDGDLDRARGLYEAASAPTRAPLERLPGLFRLSALERRRGRDDAARSPEAEFLRIASSVGAEARFTVEGLLVRSRAPSPDPDLQSDLLRLLGTTEEPIGLGLLRDAGLADPAAIARRRADLGLMERLRPLLQDRTGELANFVLGESLVVNGGLTGLGGIETLSMAVLPLPPLPPGVAVQTGQVASQGAGSLSESVEVGGSFRDTLAVATMPRAEVDATAADRARLLGGALAALLLAGSAAFALSLRASRRETEAARARADFVTKVGHDLRTPLAVVRMYAETLAAGKVADPAEAREFASVAAREAERLTGMVGQVLDLSRVAEGDGGLARRPLDLAALAREVAEVHRPLLQHAGMRLEVRAPGPLPVVGDSAALRGAVSNLLENALRHAAAGGEVALEAGPRGTMAEVRVLDRGPGIPAGMEERVFERFVRGPEAAGSGAGLGLALVREAAEAHEGTAKATAREGGGSVVTLAIPEAGHGAG